jgi:hypothetical protein
VFIITKLIDPSISMTPVSLNPPGPNSLLQGQNQFINFSPIHQDPPTLFNLLGGHDHHQARSYTYDPFLFIFLIVKSFTFPYDFF